MITFKNLCVFCGSSVGSDPIFTEATRQLATTLVENKICLIYGGAKVGLMGVLADTVLQKGGEVIGVMPKLLIDKEIAHDGLTKLHVVKSMHERKALMAELADGFIMLPGGTGSIDEFFEVLTWSQLGFHAKPCGILNVANYYDHILRFLDEAVAKQFLKQIYRNIVIAADSPEKLLADLAAYQAPSEPKWIRSVV